MVADSEVADAVSWPDLLVRACASARSLLAEVTEAQLAQPTPCTDWTVRDLVNHIVGAMQFFADLAELGQSPEDEEWPDYTSGDFLATFGRQVARAAAGFTAPGAMDKLMALPTGPTPGLIAIQVATGEIFVHSWDLAAALSAAADGTGGRDVLDDGVADALLLSDWMVLCVQVRGADPAVFAPEIEPPHGASATGRLTAFLGRDPIWKPTSRPLYAGHDRVFFRAPCDVSRTRCSNDTRFEGRGPRPWAIGWRKPRRRNLPLRPPPRSAGGWRGPAPRRVPCRLAVPPLCWLPWSCVSHLRDPPWA